MFCQVKKNVIRVCLALFDHFESFKLHAVRSTVQGTYFGMGVVKDEVSFIILNKMFHRVGNGKIYLFILFFFKVNRESGERVPP